MKKLLRITIGFFVLSLSVYAKDDNSLNHSLRPNMIHIYDTLPSEVQSIEEMFSEGIFYKRLRFNSFGFKWGEELESDSGKVLRKDHSVGAIGGSVIYKSAYLNGFSVGAGLYISQATGTLEKDEAYLYKSGKDTVNRYAALRGDPDTLLSLTQAYLEYRYKDLSIKAGRQLFESFLTRSNDTKMIPNAFEGVTATANGMLGSSFNIAYLTKQKLRDHTDFHHVLARGDVTDGDIFNIFTQNDDAAMHRGLTLSSLKERGIDDRLIVIEAKNNMVKDLRLQLNYTAVPELISSVMIQADYRFEYDDIYIIPGLRYMHQFDQGAGMIGGANLKTVTEGYSDPDDLESSLFGARVDMVHNGLKVRLGYSKVADKGDIVAPWRGFPTAGFSRVMGQYNWYANTKSYLFQVEYDYHGFTDIKIVSQFAKQDFDDTKKGVQADSNVFVLNLMKRLEFDFNEHNLYLKTRYAHSAGDSDTITDSGFHKLDSSYDELRIEFNYLF